MLKAAHSSADAVADAVRISMWVYGYSEKISTKHVGEFSRYLISKMSNGLSNVSKHIFS